MAIYMISNNSYTTIIHERVSIKVHNTSSKIWYHEGPYLEVGTGLIKKHVPDFVTIRYWNW